MRIGLAMASHLPSMAMTTISIELAFVSARGHNYCAFSFVRCAMAIAYLPLCVAAAAPATSTPQEGGGMHAPQCPASTHTLLRRQASHAQAQIARARACVCVCVCVCVCACVCVCVQGAALTLKHRGPCCPPQPTPPPVSNSEGLTHLCD